jgi:tetratricopeptide (TPR) repeat protein
MFKTGYLVSTCLIAGLICTGSMSEGYFVVADAPAENSFSLKTTISTKGGMKEQKRYESMIAALTQTIAKNPRDAEALYQRAIAYMDLNTIAESDANWAQAEDDLSRVIALDPSHAEAYFQRSKIRGGEEGRQDLDRAIALRPDYSEAYASRGVMRDSDDDDRQGALEDLNRSIALAPANSWSYLQRAFVRERLGDLQGAAADRQKATQIAPTAETYRLRAASTERVEERIANYSKAIQLDANDAWSYHFRAQSYEQTENYSAALADIGQLRRIKQTFPDNVYPDVPGTYDWQARIRRQMGDLNGAIADYTTAIQLKPKEVNSYISRASLRQQIGDYQGELADLTQVLKLDPRDFLTYFCRANVYARTFQAYQEAIQDYSQSIRYAPPGQFQANAYLARGQLHAELRAYDQAMADYTQSIQANPHQKVAYLKRAVLREQFGDRSGAQQDRQTAADLPSRQNTSEIIYGDRL